MEVGSMKKSLVFTGAIAAFVVIAPSVKATVLAPGGAPEPVSAEVLPAGSIVSNGGNVSVVSFTGIDAQGHTRYQGTLYFAVYQEAATGYLDFLYQIKNSKKSRDSLERTSNVDFSAA